MSTKTIFGGVIAILMLALYVYAVVVALVITGCLSKGAECTAYTANSFTSGMAIAMTTIGGLISALVIAELTITKPGAAPFARALGADPSGKAKIYLTITTIAYLSVWILCGLAAFVVGFMQYPGLLQPLTDLGQSWLGLAVAAAYAYLGINQGKP